MIYTQFPSTALKHSVICLGTGSFGTEISEDKSLAMLDAFAEAGGNFIDSAHIYAAWLPNGTGQSERTVGKWLRSRRPNDFIVGTKGGHPHLDSMEISRLSPEEIANDLNDSLERLQRDQIEMYWLHRDDPQIPVDEIMGALNTHIQSGKILALGASNWNTDRIEAANAVASKEGWTGFSASQIRWSLAEVNPAMQGNAGMVQMDESILTWHRAKGFPAASYSSQANGFFAHPLPNPNGTMTEKQKSLAPTYLSPKNRERYQRAEGLGRKLGRSAHEIALAYMWSQSFPSIAIIGPGRLEQLRESLLVADLKLSPDEVSLLEADA